MTSADTEAMQALQELLAERQRYEGWIRTLESHQATTPEHVFTRVHTDYTLRLDRVMQRLAERTEQLQSTVEALSARLAGLRSKESDRLDARQEAELRAAVGEFGDEEWTRLREAADREIGGLAAERQDVEQELAGIQEIVDLSRGTKREAEKEPETAPATSSAPRAMTPQATVAETTTDRAAHTDGKAPDATVAEEAPSIDNFVADWPVRHVSDVAAAQAQGDGIAEVPEVDAASPTVAAQDHVTPKFAPPSSRAAWSPVASPASPSQDPTSPSDDHRREQEKTLKCPECGTMNYATEWYCERCGGELATF